MVVLPAEVNCDGFIKPSPYFFSPLTLNGCMVGSCLSKSMYLAAGARHIFCPCTYNALVYDYIQVCTYFALSLEKRQICRQKLVHHAVLLVPVLPESPVFYTIMGIYITLAPSLGS